MITVQNTSPDPHVADLVIRDFVTTRDEALSTVTMRVSTRGGVMTVNIGEIENAVIQHGPTDYYVGMYVRLIVEDAPIPLLVRAHGSLTAGRYADLVATKGKHIIVIPHTPANEMILVRAPMMYLSDNGLTVIDVDRYAVGFPVITAEEVVRNYWERCPAWCYSE